MTIMTLTDRIKELERVEDRIGDEIVVLAQKRERIRREINELLEARDGPSRTKAALGE
jgi:prefoldin subunit 5